MLSQVRRARHCSPSVVCVVLVMLVPLSLQTESRWGLEYPVVPWEDMWQEMEMMSKDKNCPTESSTCWHTSNATTPQQLVPQVCRPCACDDECVLYGDCCRDKAQADWGDGREEGTGRYNCRRLRPWDYQGLLMVESCLPEYRDHPVERLCTQKVPPEEYTYILDLSVTSRLTNTTYANYHCAVCNNDASSLHVHRVNINCRTTEIKKEFTMQEFMSKAVYRPGSLMLDRYVYRNEEDERHSIHREHHTCSLEVAEFINPEKFAEKYGGRLCLYPKSGCNPRLLGRRSHCMQQMRHCHPDWPDPLDVEKCHRYSQLVLHTVGGSRTTLYKNLHCAKCNFVNMSSGQFQCLDPYDFNVCSSLNGSRSMYLPPVFSVLMDFRNTSCDATNELWDPIHLACRKVFCGQLYKLEKGVCVRDPAALAVLRNSTLLDDSCRKINLSESEYIPRSDGSVFVNATKRVYEQGEYEMLSEGDVLICNDYDDYFASFTLLHQLLTLVTIVISLVGLGLHIIIYMLVPRYRNLPGKNLFCLSCCLFLAYLLFLTGMKATEHRGLCVFISSALHFFWLAAFCWMNVMSVDVCRTFNSQVYRGDPAGNRTFVLYSLYAWSVPAVVVALALIFDFMDILPDYRPRYATDLCWINSRYGLALFFLLPQGAIVLENTLLFLVTARGIYKQVQAAKYASTRSQSVKGARNEKNSRAEQKTGPKEGMQGRRSKKDRLRLILYMKLAVIQGVSWVTGFIAAFSDLSFCWYIFTVFNGLQGAFIFLGFDMKRKVLESVWETLVGTPWRKRKSSKDTRTTSMGTTTNNSNSDSDEGNELDSTLAGPLVRQKGVGWQAGVGVDWSSSTKHCPPSQTFDRVRKVGITGSQKTSSDQFAGQPQVVQEAKASPSQAVKKTDLRARVVRGNFDGEDTEPLKLASDVPLLPQDQTPSQPKTNKPNVQRVMSLLQQLQQQSQSSVDLPDLVQQLLRRNGDSLKGTEQDRSTLPKCRSFTEGACPEIKDEQQRALVAQLRSMAAGSFRAETGNHGLPKTPSTHHQPSSLNHTANTSYNSLYTPSKSLPSQMSADNRAAIVSPQIKRSQNSSNNLHRTPKSQ